MTYQPKYPMKGAPGSARGKIAWTDDGTLPRHLRYNGSTWEIRPVEGDGPRVKEGFSTGESLGERKTAVEAWYAAASGFTQEYVEPEPVTLNEVGQQLVTQAKGLTPTANHMIWKFAELLSADSGPAFTCGFTTIDTDKTTETYVFTAEREMKDLRVKVSQSYGVDRTGARKTVADPVRVEVFLNGEPNATVTHPLRSTSKVTWFFTAEDSQVRAWTTAARKRLAKAAHSTSA